MLEIRLQLTFRQKITQGESTIIPKLASPIPRPGQGVSLVSSLCDCYSFPYCLSAAAKGLQTPGFWVFLSSGACHLDYWRLTRGRQDFINVYVRFFHQNEHYPADPREGLTSTSIFWVRVRRHNCEGCWRQSQPLWFEDTMVMPRGQMSTAVAESPAGVEGHSQLLNCNWKGREEWGSGK